MAVKLILPFVTLMAPFMELSVIEFIQEAVDHYCPCKLIILMGNWNILFSFHHVSSVDLCWHFGLDWKEQCSQILPEPLMCNPSNEP